MDKITKNTPSNDKETDTPIEEKHIEETIENKITENSESNIEHEKSNVDSDEDIVNASDDLRSETKKSTGHKKRTTETNRRERKTTEVTKPKRHKRKYKLSLKKIIRNIIILAVIVILSILTTKGLYELGVFIASQRQIVTKSQEISITSTGTLDYERFQKGVLVANSGTLTYFNSDLETVWEIPGCDGIPVINTNDKYALVAYTDTQNAKLIADSNAISINCSGKIVSSYINKNGYFALVMTEDGYKNQIAVYDNNGNVFYKWHSAENYVTSVAVSPDNKSMAASTIGFTENGFDSGVMIFDFAQSSPYAGQHQSDNLIMDIEYVAKDKIVAIGDKATTFYKTNGNKINDINYADKNLITFDVTDTDKTVLCFARDDSAMSNCDIYSYGSNGKLNGEFAIEGRILSISTCDNKLLVAKDGQFDLLTDKCKRVRNTALVRDLENSVLFNGGKYAFVISGNLAQVIKIN